GPHTYTERYGDETAVVRIHSGNGPHEEMDQRAIACFDQALEDVGLTDQPLRQVLHDYFARATTTTMSAYHHSADDVPEGLRSPRWSWDGLQHGTHILARASAGRTRPAARRWSVAAVVGGCDDLGPDVRERAEQGASRDRFAALV